MPDYLTTRELAELLRIKERKVYELVSDNVIPVSRVTGKLLFPRDIIEAWLNRHTEFGAGEAALKAHDPMIAGSHDPLLEWALRESGAGLAVLSDGSSDGLKRLAAGTAMAAGIHLPEASRARPSRLPSKNAASSLPDWRSAHSSKGSWLPASTDGRACRPSVPPAYSACRQTQASTISRGNSSLPVTRLTGIACSATSS